jgi:multiple sugar transport system permease protein
METKASQRLLDWAIIVVMAVIGFFMLLPFAWLFSMSFRTVKDAYQMPPSFLPPRLDFDNYRAVLNSSIPFLQIYANSVEVAVIVTIGQLITCTLAAFAFARLNFPGRDTLFFVMLAGLLFPAQVTIIPIYLGFARVGLLNRPIGLALMYLTSSFGVFLVRQFMRSQPKALEEAPATPRSSFASPCPSCGRPLRRSASSLSPRPGTTISRRGCFLSRKIP